jgi:hypothetical protein
MSSVLPPYLTYWQQYGLIICSTHQTALHDTKIIDHLTKHHYETSINQSDLDTYHITTIATSHHMILADQPIDLIPHLKPPQLGYQCNQCNHLRLRLKNLRDHLFQAHQVSGYQAQDDQIITCPIQALAGAAYLFRVKAPDQTQPTTKRSRQLSLPNSTLAPLPQRPRLQNHQTPQAATLQAQFLARFDTLRQSLKSSRVIHTQSETYEARGFFTNSQYPLFLNGRDAADLEHLFALDNPDQMIWLSAIIYRLFRQGQALIPHTSTQSLSALNSFSQDPINQASLRPLRPLQNQASEKKYCLIFQAFINFLLQSYRYLKANGPASYQGLYLLSPDQLGALQALETFLLGLPTPDPISLDQQGGSHANIDDVNIDDVNIYHDSDSDSDSVLESVDLDDEALP